jgi:PAS domain S-box-containing protein
MNEATEQGWLYRRIVEDSPLAILFADREGKIRLWNTGAEAMFGYTPEEALGQSLDLIVPEKQRARHWEGWERVMATGVTKYGREPLAVPSSRKDGSRVSIEFHIVLLRGPAGELVGAAALVQDVTVRFQQQKELRARLAALEAQAAGGAKAS